MFNCHLNANARESGKTLKWHFVTTSLGHISRPKSLSPKQYLVSYESKSASGTL